MRILLIGHGTHGAARRSARAEYGCEVAGIVDRCDGADGVDADRLDGRRRRDRLLVARRGVPATSRRWRGAGINVVHRHDRVGRARGRAAARRRRRRGIGVVAAPNFSLGVVLFECDRAAARPKLFAGTTEFGAWMHEAHHAAKNDAPSGTALLLERAMRDGRFHAADRRVVDARRDRFRARTRLVSTARPKRSR